jgi:hypothetical protein
MLLGGLPARKSRVYTYSPYQYRLDWPFFVTALCYLFLAASLLLVWCAYLFFYLWRFAPLPASIKPARLADAQVFQKQFPAADCIEPPML